jgi:hypothetical protein
MYKKKSKWILLVERKNWVKELTAHIMSIQVAQNWVKELTAHIMSTIQVAQYKHAIPIITNNTSTKTSNPKLSKKQQSNQKDKTSSNANKSYRYPKYQLAIAHVRNFAAKVIDLPRKIFKILRMSHMGLTWNKNKNSLINLVVINTKWYKI